MPKAPIPADMTTETPNAALLQGLFASATGFACITLTAEGTVTSWNASATTLFGYTPAEMLGCSLDRIFPSEDRAAATPQRERQAVLQHGPLETERWFCGKAGLRLWASGTLAPLGAGLDGLGWILRGGTGQRRAEQQLRRSEERFRVLATGIPHLVFRGRADGRRSWGSPQWIAFTGLGLRQSLGHGWLAAIHPDDVAATRSAWDGAAERGEYYMEHRVWCAADAEYRWYQTRACPVASAIGRRGEWVGTMTDIDELRSLQERQKVLLAELQHRTRNLLAVVQSIASQTAGKVDTAKPFVDEFKGRLGALARVQTLLAESDQRDIDLHALLLAELTAHGSAAIGSGHVTIDGPRIAMPAAAAQVVGLALHELATNAVKYGALRQSQAALRVTWTVDAAAQPLLRLQWHESGVVMAGPSSERRQGYGTELIRRALPYQLKTETRFDFLEDGVLCAITVPLRRPDAATGGAATAP